MTTKKKLGYLVGIMLLLIVAGGIIVNIFTKNREKNSSDNYGYQNQLQSQSKNTLQVVTTFYPMYIIAENIFDQVEGASVTNLTDLNAGCAHDYQLTTDNMKLLSTADMIIVNGGGLEGFLEDVIADFPNLTVIDSSENIPMLAYDEHSEEESEHDSQDGHAHGEHNSHIWLDPSMYKMQIKNIRDGILNYLKERKTSNTLDTDIGDQLAAKIEENANAYISKVQELDQRLEMLKKVKADTIGVAIFHDTFAYLAKRLGLEVEYRIEVDSETALGAKDIKNIIDLIHEGKIHYLFAENQYGEMVTTKIQGETNVEVFILDPVIIGNGSKDSYLEAMESNIQLLEAILH